MQQRVLTYADLWRPSSKESAIVYDVMLVMAGSWALALFAQIAIPLPHTPVPITGQSFAVLMLGVLLGSRKGAASVMAYLAQGACGLPFFAGGKAGLAILSGVTAGYFAGFVAAAYVAGWLAEKGADRNVFTSVLAMLVGTAVIFAFGLSWLSVILPAGSVLALGLYPFLPGALIKLVAAAVLLPAGWAFLGKTHSHK